MAFRDPERNSSSGVKFLFFIICSLLFHGLLIFVKIDLENDDEDLVTIKYYDLDGSAFKNLQPEKAVPKKKDTDIPKGQIVDIAKPKNQEKPVRSRFLAEFDSSVDKEKRSDFDPAINVRGRKLRKNLSEKALPGNSDEEFQTASDSVAKATDFEKKKIKKGAMKGFSGSDGKYLKGEDKEKSGLILAKDKIDQEGTDFVGGHKIPRRFLPYLNGNDTMLTSPSNDFLKDVEKGEETELNTKRFIYAAYFNKIKQAISKHWTPSFVLMINDPGARLYGKKSRFTKLIVHISSNGELVSAVVETSSGIDFLDREAINAFKAASPFSSPPEVLLGKNNTLEIRFGFMVTME
jgi:TonB family protein